MALMALIALMALMVKCVSGTKRYPDQVFCARTCGFGATVERNDERHSVFYDI
jgi:hypothetical protein